MDAMSLHRLIVVITVTVASCCAIACGDPEYHYSEADDGSPDLSDDNQGSNDSPATDLELTATTDTTFEVYAGSSVDIGVQLTDGEPRSTEPIEFEVTTSTGDGDIRLDAPTVYTDDEGTAPNQLDVGELTGELTVRASYTGAEPVDFDVTVTEVPEGDLLVDFDYADADLLALSDLEVRLFDSTHVECDFIVPYTAPDTSHIDENSVPSTDDGVPFYELAVDRGYTVSVTALGPEDQISAHGCMEAIELDGDQTTEITVDLALLDLGPTGSYAIESTWDMTEAVAAAGPVGQAISDVFDWISDPTGMAADYMVGLAVDWVCNNYGSTACGYAQDAEDDGTLQSMLSDFLDDQISNIGILSDFQSMADDLTEAVENMHVDSLLTIDNKAVGEGELSGTDVWTGVSFQWPIGCTSNCQDVEFGLGSDTDFGAIEAQWDGRLTDYDRLEIDPHEMTVPYGQFITLILNDVLIPALTNDNADDLTGAFEYLLCDNLDSLEVTVFGYTIDFGSSTLQGFCYDAFSTVGGLAEIYITNLDYDLDFQVSGEGRMIDLESDGDVDVIEDGIFYGEVEGEDGEATDLESEFSGERIE